MTAKLIEMNNFEEEMIRFEAEIRRSNSAVAAVAAAQYRGGQGKVHLDPTVMPHQVKTLRRTLYIDYYSETPCKPLPKHSVGS